MRISPLSGSTAAGQWQADLTMASLPSDIQDKVMNTVSTYMKVTPEEAANNLNDVANSMNPEDFAKAAAWYDTAKDFNTSVAEAYGADPHLVTAVTAALSPGMEWDQNMRATQGMVAAFSDNMAIDDKTAAAVNAVLDKNPSDAGDFRVSAGQKLQDILQSSPRAAGIAVARSLGISLRSYDNFTKAANLLKAGDTKSIGDILAGPKVRSFFNNMERPHGSDVTVDSHMMDAMVNGLGSEAGHERMAVIHDRSIVSRLTGSPSYKGASLGVYPALADVTRQATSTYNAAHGTHWTPPEFQAAVWTQQINMYPRSRMRSITSGR